jgi:CPA2 family monovalent cation:H+ antiporter-2
VIDTRSTALEALTASGIETIDGNAADHAVFAAAKPEAARCLFVAVPNAFEAGAIVEQARAANTSLPIIARAHSDAEARHLAALGATATVIGETELALEMLRRAPVPASP